MLRKVSLVLVMLTLAGVCLAKSVDSSDEYNFSLRSGDRLTAEQVAQLLTTIADNQQKQTGSQQQERQGSDESYQRVYESVARLVRTMSQNNLSNMRRFVARLNALVGGASTSSPSSSSSSVREQEDQSTEQILDRLDNVRPGQTDSHSLRQLNDDITKFISTLSDSYLRNIRRVIERMDKVIGSPAPPPSSASMYASSDDQLDYNNPQQNGGGFPGWDELIVAFDRIQKSLAQFVRSSTRLATSG